MRIGLKLETTFDGEGEDLRVTLANVLYYAFAYAKPGDAIRKDINEVFSALNKPFEGFRKYSCDPGLPDETAFYYPAEWNNYLDTWPSCLGAQPDDEFHYCPENRSKTAVHLIGTPHTVFLDK